jgi:ABC-type lipoprotein export system ATPase subunit
MMTGITCRDLTVVKQAADGSELTILDHINATFPRKRTAVIRGETGSGKSTFLHVLSGLVRPDSGEVCADGEPVSRFLTPRKDLWRRKAGIVFQHPVYQRDLTVLENVMMPLIPVEDSMDAVREKAREMLGDAGLDGKASERASVLSGGELQRMTIARALVSRPGFVFADEPTSHQDHRHLDIVLDLLGRPLAWDGVVIVTTHDARLVDGNFGDRCHQMCSGRLEGT